jgi:hypothetical protein
VVCNDGESKSYSCKIVNQPPSTHHLLLQSKLIFISVPKVNENITLTFSIPLIDWDMGCWSEFRLSEVEGTPRDPPVQLFIFLVRKYRCREEVISPNHATLRTST